MKKLLVASFITGALAFSSVQTAESAVGWCGNNWPNSGSTHASNADINIYFQVWKSGVTDSPGQGSSIAGTLYYREVGEPTYETAPMSYWGDVGNNDEYTAAIPMAALSGVSQIEFYVKILDTTDGAECYGNDQNGFGPMDPNNPGTFNITAATSQAVDVTFSVDMNAFCGATIDSVIATGTFTGWTSSPSGAVVLSDGNSDGIWEGTHQFPLGSSPSQTYKFIHFADGSSNANWESTGDRQLTIEDTSSTQILPIVWFNDNPAGNVTSQAVDVFFQVDMSQVDTFTTVYLNGDFLGWSGTDMQLNLISGSIYGGIYSFPICANKSQGYKFTYVDTSGATVWESLTDNRNLDIDDSTPSQNLSVVYFSDIGPAANLEDVSVTVSPIGNDVVLNWNLDPVATEYKVYRSTSPNFTPGVSNLLTTLGAVATWTDSGAATSNQLYFYIVKSGN